ncbi:MAG: type II toxin-antitoxin system RelE/ParE family toxin [Verrucomicrobiota bacterium]
MTYQVQLTQEARQDLLDLHDYVAAHDSPAKADALLVRLEDVCANLARLPNRGHCPPELKRIGVELYREIHFKPYRVFFTIDRNEVVVRAILDGRRDMQSLLEHRLIR